MSTREQHALAFSGILILIMVLVIIVANFAVDVAGNEHKENSQAIKEFSNLIKNYNCIDELPQDLVRKYYNVIGPKAILDAVVNKKTFCHHICHNIGYVIMEQEKDFTKSMEICGDRCSSACFHGVVRNLGSNNMLLKPHKHKNDNIHSHIDDENEILADLCLDQGIVESNNTFVCMHGLGHAITLLEDYNISSAVDRCNNIFLDSGKENGFICATGVFMERNGLFWKNDMNVSFTYPCDEAKDHPSACYGLKVIRLVGGGMDFNKIVDICSELNSSQRNGCFSGIGRASAAQYWQNFFKRKGNWQIDVACSYGTIQNQQMCVQGYIMKINEFLVGAKNANCNLLKRAFHLPWCNSELKDQICERLEAHLRSVCLESKNRIFLGGFIDTKNYFYMDSI